MPVPRNSFMGGSSVKRISNRFSAPRLMQSFASRRLSFPPVLCSVKNPGEKTSCAASPLKGACKLSPKILRIRRELTYTQGLAFQPLSVTGMDISFILLMVTTRSPINWCWRYRRMSQQGCYKLYCRQYRPCCSRSRWLKLKRFPFSERPKT